MLFRVKNVDKHGLNWQVTQPWKQVSEEDGALQQGSQKKI